MKIEKTDFKGLFVITPSIFKDERGFFMELYRQDKFEEIGIRGNFTQENQSRSKKNVIRGLHFQWNPPLGKLIRAAKGAVFSVAVDLRKNSKTFGKWFGVNLDEDSNKEMYAAPGFATGFCVLSDMAEVHYGYTNLYNPKGESNILWNDRKIGIIWPVKNPILSERDKNAQTFDEWLNRKESDSFS